MVRAAFPRYRRALFFQEFEFDGFTGRYADVIVPGWVLVDDLIVQRSDGFGRIPIAELAYAASQVHVLSERGGGIVHHKPDADLIPGQHFEVVMYIA